MTPASVDGQDAVWTTYSGAKLREAFLRWRYAPGSWAEVRVADRTGDVGETALRVAENLGLSSTDRVKLPFGVTGLPAALRPILVNVVDAPSAATRWSATVSFSAAPAGSDPGQQRGTMLDVTAWPYAHQDTEGTNSAGKEFPRPNTSVDGHPAHRGPRSGPATDLTVYDVAGVNVDVHANHPDVLRQLGPEGCVATYRGVHLVDQAGGWKTGLS
ncbi:hypothetical protein [Plantactinospora veratri]